MTASGRSKNSIPFELNIVDEESSSLLPTEARNTPNGHASKSNSPSSEATVERLGSAAITLDHSQRSSNAIDAQIVVNQAEQVSHLEKHAAATAGSSISSMNRRVNFIRTQRARRSWLHSIFGCSSGHSMFGLCRLCTKQDLDFEFSIPPILQHPLEERIVLSTIRLGLYYVICTIIAVPLLCIVAIAYSVALLVRWLCFSVKHRTLSCSVFRSRELFTNSCDPFWPMTSLDTKHFERSTKISATAAQASSTNSIDKIQSSQNSIPRLSLSNGGSKQMNLFDGRSFSHSVVTLSRSITLAQIRNLVLQRIVDCKNTEGHYVYPQFRSCLRKSCNGRSVYWDNVADVNFDISHHVVCYSGLTMSPAAFVNTMSPVSNTTTTTAGEQQLQLPRYCTSSRTPVQCSPVLSGGRAFAHQMQSADLLPQSRCEADRKSSVQTLRDLEGYLNRLVQNCTLDISQPPWRIVVIFDFGETKCTLVLFHLHHLIMDKLCISKLLSKLTDTDLAFTYEPRLDDSLSQRAWFITQALMLQPFEYFKASVQSFSAVNFWKQLRIRQVERTRRDAKLQQLKELKSQQYLRSIETNSVLPSPGSDQALMQSLATDSTFPQPSPYVAEPEVVANKNIVTWARIPDVDRLLRAEKLLHVRTEEMFMAFIAGTLQRHFKQQGLRYPPDMKCAVPISMKRGVVNVTRDCECKFSVVPVQLPVSVEGSIPRIWEVQRQLEESLDGPAPHGMYACGHFFRTVFPGKDFAKKAQYLPLKGCTAVISFIRGFANACNDAERLAASATDPTSICDHKVHSILQLVPFPDDIPCTFTFIQLGREIVLSMRCDSTLFPSPDALLLSFQREIHKLLGQISGRLLSPLSTSSLIPPMIWQSAVRPVGISPPMSVETFNQVPRAPSAEPNSELMFGDECSDDFGPSASEEAATAAAVAMFNRADVNQERPATSGYSISRSCGGSGTRTPPNVVSQSISYGGGNSLAVTNTSLSNANEDDVSIEELENLLSTVSAELANMKSHPSNRNRYSNLMKLGDFEQRMIDLQSKIADKLRNHGNVVFLNDREGGAALHDLLGGSAASSGVASSSPRIAYGVPLRKISGPSPNLSGNRSPASLLLNKATAVVQQQQPRSRSEQDCLAQLSQDQKLPIKRKRSRRTSSPNAINRDQYVGNNP